MCLCDFVVGREEEKRVTIRFLLLLLLFKLFKLSETFELFFPQKGLSLSVQKLVACGKGRDGRGGGGGGGGEEEEMDRHRDETNATTGEAPEEDGGDCDETAENAFAQAYAYKRAARLRQW